MYRADTLLDTLAAYLLDPTPTGAVVLQRHLNAAYQAIEDALAGTGVTPLSRRLLGRYSLTAEGESYLAATAGHCPCRECQQEAAELAAMDAERAAADLA